MEPGEFPCPVCGTPVCDYDDCPNCYFENEGKGFDEKYPDETLGLHKYTLNEARAWYKEGGVELTRKMILQDDRWAKNKFSIHNHPEPIE